MNDTEDIITKFELFAGDETELSSQEELDLLQKVYNEVLNAHEWEFLKKTASGTLSTSVNYITQPADFDRMTSKQTIFIGNSYGQYKVLPFEEKRTYVNQQSNVYYDARLGQFIFTTQPTVADTYEFDYIYVPAALDIVSSNPVFPKRFWDLLYHKMLVDNDIIQMSDKARSYLAVNQARYDSILADMKYWNDRISGYDTYGI